MPHKIPQSARPDFATMRSVRDEVFSIWVPVVSG